MAEFVYFVENQRISKMSFGFRERLRMALRQSLKEKLGLSEKDIQFIWENIGTFCSHSDDLLEALKKYEHSDKSIDEIVEELSDADFADLVREILEFGFKKLDYKKQKDEKKSEEKSEEKETDSDSDTDADSVESETVQTEEQEVECQE